MRNLIFLLSLTLNVVTQDLTFNELIQRGREALSEGRFAVSESLLRAALEKADAGANPLEKVLARSDLASLLTYAGRNAEAQEHLESALKMLRNMPDANPAYLTAVLVNLGGVYKDTGRLRDSESVLNQAKEILVKNPDGQRPQSMGDVLNNLGVLYSVTGRRRLAETTLKQAMALDEKLQTEPVTAARTLINLAGLYQIEKKMKLAEPMLLRAQQILERELGPDHPLVSNVLNNLGILYTVEGSYEKAETLLRHALDIRTRTLGSENLAVIATKVILADALTAQGAYEEAQLLYSESLSVQERLSGSRSAGVGVILEHLAKLLRLKSDKEASAMEGRARAIHRQLELILPATDRALR